jgi:hypothetical protein
MRNEGGGVRVMLEEVSHKDARLRYGVCFAGLCFAGVNFRETELMQ